MLIFVERIDSASVNRPKNGKRKNTKELFFYFCPKEVKSIPLSAWFYLEKLF